MNSAVSNHLSNALHHLYINPLEKCNLHCKICYTKKTGDMLSPVQIINFVAKYHKSYELQTITFCGGEVFALSYFPEVVNTLNEQGFFVQIITNGTIDKLHLLQHPNSVNLLVSIDGVEKYHDKNRGEGNFQTSIDYIKKAQQMGFHTEIFSILTRQNLPQREKFEQFVTNELNNTPITYHPRKPPAYLKNHPTSNITGEVEGFDFLTNEEMKAVMKLPNVFPPKELGCYQISLMSDGNIYGCCEGTMPIGTINDSIEDLFEQMKKRLELWYNTNETNRCLGCTQPEFMCGVKELIIND
ncbi:radical SAM protein [Candidatus Roizmanbacteria bacterium]|nr:radical SAM protein [Candidatus Roizmanbacteria bacterium]